MDELEELDYPNPPVVEVALSVQFDRLLGLDAPMLGAYWSRVRDRFPFAEQHPPLQMVQEAFGPPDATARALRIELSESVQTPRFWLLNSDRSQLLQIQDDRFAHNWRKNVTPYPHYEMVRAAFVEELLRFSAFIETEDLGQLAANQCEVTYINHVMVPDGASQADLGELLTMWSQPSTVDVPGSAEDCFLHLRYKFATASGESIGRVHVDVQPAFEQEQLRPLWVLSLTARGRPLGQGIDGIVDFLNLGRGHVLKTFVGITNAKRQTEWEGK